jgi:hypothetical protein
MARLLRLKDLLEMDGQSPLQQKPLSFDDLHQTEYRPGEDELTNYRAYRRRKFGVGTGEGGPIGESTELEFDEALNMQQRMARKRQIKRFKSKIEMGRKRARRRMASKDTLEKRAQKQARTTLLKKITKGIPKDELSYARRQEIEKRLDKPAMKAKIKVIARKLFKDVRKKEVERKKG